MYAAAGGASLASRQARQKQREKKKQQILKNQKASDLHPKQLQAKQFHNYTDDPTTVPKPLTRGTLKPPPGQPNDRRHSSSNCHLKEPSSKSRLRESPSISIPVQNHHQPPQPLTPCTLVHHHNHLPSTTSLHQSQLLPQIFMPEGDDKLERRCSFVRQVEEMEKCQEGGLLDRCNHICNFEIKDKQWDNTHYYADYERDFYGSLEYPFSECSQGRAAWQERERGRRCSLSEEAQKIRLKQTEAHRRWMKRNQIHDSTYSGGSDDEDFFSVYHQSAAANALLYVGLGTTAIGSVIFFVGTGEKGFKTLELRLIGPTLIACGLLCCLIRVLLCACPSTCLRKRKKTRLKNTSYNNRYPPAPKYRDPDFIQLDNASLLQKQKKKVSIVPPNHSLPSTSTTEFKELPQHQTSIFLPEANEEDEDEVEENLLKISVPQISVAADLSSSSIIELQNFDLNYEIESLSSNDDSDSLTVASTTDKTVISSNKLARTREAANSMMVKSSSSISENTETCLSVVIERNDNSESSEPISGFTTNKKNSIASDNKKTHSGIVLSPLQLGQ